jgi:hypothetical protein
MWPAATGVIIAEWSIPAVLAPVAYLPVPAIADKAFPSI